MFLRKIIIKALIKLKWLCVRVKWDASHKYKVVGENTFWQARSIKQCKRMKDGLAKLTEQGIEAIED